MPNWIWGVAFLVAYVVLTQWLLPRLGARLFRRPTLRRTMTTIVQVEFRESLLSIRGSAIP